MHKSQNTASLYHNLKQNSSRLQSCFFLLSHIPLNSPLKMDGARSRTSRCLIDLEFLPLIPINQRNSETEWADLNPQSAFLKTGLIYMQACKKRVPWVLRNPSYSDFSSICLVFRQIMTSACAKYIEHKKYHVKTM